MRSSGHATGGRFIVGANLQMRADRTDAVYSDVRQNYQNYQKFDLEKF